MPQLVQYESVQYKYGTYHKKNKVLILTSQNMTVFMTSVLNI